MRLPSPLRLAAGWLPLALALAGCGTAGAASSVNPAPPRTQATIATQDAVIATQDAVPVASALPAFQCQHDESGGGSPATTVTAVRAASHPGFDRLVIEFGGGVAGYQVARQPTATFVEDASGRQVTLAGTAGLRVRLSPATAFGTYPGPNDIATRLPVIREVRLIGDFEAVNTWGVGLAQPACIRAFSLANPSRLVVDVQR
jgi:hypothetical protein